MRRPGDVDNLLGSHRILVGPRGDAGSFPGNQVIIAESHTDRQTTLLVRTSEPVIDPAWTISQVGLEDIVLAYMSLDASVPRRPALEVQK